MIAVFRKLKTLLRKNEPLVFRATIYFFQLTRVQSIGPLELTWKIESFPTFRNLVNNKNNNTSKSKDGLCSYGIPLSNDTLYLEKGFVCVVFDSHKPADHISSKSWIGKREILECPTLSSPFSSMHDFQLTDPHVRSGRIQCTNIQFTKIRCH